MIDAIDSGQDVIAWEPDEQTIERSRLRGLMARMGVPRLTELYAAVADDPERYWRHVLADLDLVWHQPYDGVWDLACGKAWPQWFPGAGFNYVTSALERHARGAARDRVAVIWEGDDESVRRLTFGELDTLTNRFANALRSLGVGKGDREQLPQNRIVRETSRFGLLDGRLRLYPTNPWSDRSPFILVRSRDWR